MPLEPENALSSDERNAMRSYLQRAEVRLSTTHRIASAFLGGAGLLILFPVFFNQAIASIMSVLIKDADRSTHYASVLLGVPLIISIAIPLCALYLLLRDLVHFYFVGHSPGFSNRLFNPRFVLSGILFSPDESRKVKRQVYVEQYGSDIINFVLPFGEEQASYYDQVIRNTKNDIIPEERKRKQLESEGVIKIKGEIYIVENGAELHGCNIDRFSAAFGLAGARDRDLVIEVAKMEASLVRHVTSLRRLLLRYMKALLLFILTALILFTLSALVGHFAGDHSSIRLVILSFGFVSWAVSTMIVVRRPVAWIEQTASADAEQWLASTFSGSPLVQRDAQLVEFERVVILSAALSIVACVLAMVQIVR